ncbi:hypothetical protein L211DRAFT_864061 [Terfezia boudieri ATCC MYA-4762]|uniref:Uncharacterized protein n=1 Tax=Terfezia boudieri ATCC MYA-4762 TaxID=1051890 RepID=A0A3N4M311_9PEZI|nr:hypothetical protein L211DRAFT_864061 [Terfezia boudieri ATCC MYA-4762]
MSNYSGSNRSAVLSLIGARYTTTYYHAALWITTFSMLYKAPMTAAMAQGYALRLIFQYHYLTYLSTGLHYQCFTASSFLESLARIFKKPTGKYRIRTPYVEQQENDENKPQGNYPQKTPSFCIEPHVPPDPLQQDKLGYTRILLAVSHTSHKVVPINSLILNE